MVIEKIKMVPFHTYQYKDKDAIFGNGRLILFRTLVFPVHARAASADGERCLDLFPRPLKKYFSLSTTASI